MRTLSCTPVMLAPGAHDFLRSRFFLAIRLTDGA